MWLFCQVCFLEVFSVKLKVHGYSLTIGVTEGFVFNIKPSVGDQFIGMEVDCDRIAIFFVSVVF